MLWLTLALLSCLGPSQDSDEPVESDTDTDSDTDSDSDADTDSDTDTDTDADSDTDSDTDTDTDTDVVPVQLFCPVQPLDGTETEDWHFTPVGVAAGVDVNHGYPDNSENDNMWYAGGVAVADIDGDCDLDAFLPRGREGANALLVNNNDGTYTDQGVALGLERFFVSSAPVFGDLDADGDVDLIVGGTLGGRTGVFRNDGPAGFVDTTSDWGLLVTRDSYASALVDYDGDGDLDLAQAHWWLSETQLLDPQRLWRNDSGTFVDVTAASGLNGFNYAFCMSFADFDSDGDPDLAIAGDFEQSTALRNDAGVFLATSQPLTDENGMGGAVGDVDGDGDLDWFVTSISGPPASVDEIPRGHSGNRLYLNDGAGNFTDQSELAGVRDGGWGWGACMADFDNDGHLDIFHVNGMGAASVPAEFLVEPARLFHNNGDGTFTQMAADVGIADNGMGRGVVCADADRDGDLDVWIANVGQPHRLYRNDGGNSGHFLEVIAPIGTWVEIDAGGRTQVRQVIGGGGFQGSGPAEVHFGLGSTTTIDELRVAYPQAEATILTAVDSNQILVFE